jgi:hypothetical protein
MGRKISVENWYFGHMSPLIFISKTRNPVLAPEHLIIGKLGRKSGRFTNPFVWTGPGENIFSILLPPQSHPPSSVTYVGVETVCLEKLSFFIFDLNVPPPSSVTYVDVDTVCLDEKKKRLGKSQKAAFILDSITKSFCDNSTNCYPTPQ